MRTERRLVGRGVASAMLRDGSPWNGDVVIDIGADELQPDDFLTVLVMVPTFGAENWD